MTMLGLKILKLHESTQFKGSEEAAGSSVPNVTEEPDEPYELSGEDGQFDPDKDPILMQIYADDAQSRADREQSLEATMDEMEEEHKAFHAILDSHVRESAKSKTRMQSVQAPVKLSELPVERVEQLCYQVCKGGI
eukprot:4212158-Amphidinium_carterae.3